MTDLRLVEKRGAYMQAACDGTDRRHGGNDWRR